MERPVRHKLSFQMPEPLPWHERDPVLGAIRGDRAFALDDLARLLEFVGDGIEKNRPIAWPSSHEEVSTSKAIAPIVSSGLILRDRYKIYLSRYGKEWLARRNPQFLIGVFHAHVRFVGELLHELEEEPITQVELLRIAREHYDFGWTTGGPIHSRTKWLQAAGLVDIFSHKAHLTAAGRSFLSNVAVYKPEEKDLSPADLQPAPKVIADLLEKSKNRPEIRSRAGSCYIPSVKSGNGQLDAMRNMVESCDSATRDEILIEKACDIFDISATTADTIIRSLKLFGLLERVSSTEIAATPAALAWLGSGYSIDLARIIHASVWYFGEIVALLEDSGKMTFTQILDCCGEYSNQGRYENLKRGGLTARIAILEALNLITNISNNYYGSTSLGRAFCQSVPCIDRDSGGVAVQPDSASTPAGSGNEADAAASLADEVAEALIRAARMSEKSELLEKAAIDALNFLGLSAHHIGGHGEPDGTLRTRPGKLGAVLTVETKSAASGIVPEEQAKPATLADHRDQHGAESTVYIGPGFERRLLDVLDNDSRVAVVSVGVIAEAVRRQVNSPLTADELAPLIDPALLESDRRARLLAKWKEKEDWALCMQGVIAILSREAESPMSDEETSSAGVGWLDTTAIRRSLRDLMDRDISKELIGEVLDFLVSPQVSIAESLRERYRLRVAVDAIPRHFEYLGRRWLVGQRALGH